MRSLFAEFAGKSARVNRAGEAEEAEEAGGEEIRDVCTHD